MPLRPSRPGSGGARGASRRRGYTLVEVVVVLVLLGLAIALVAPSLVPPRATPDDAVQQVIDAARRLAVRRASAVTLSLDAEGRWVVDEAGLAGAPPLLAGALARPPASALRLHISPLGACLRDPAPAAAAAPPDLDPVRCRLGGR
jgi:prepilin-type N-terminal cleavage/methylation domain-containing protein